MLSLFPPPAPSHAHTLAKTVSVLAWEGEVILYISFQRGLSLPLEPLYGRPRLSMPLGVRGGVLVPSGHRLGPTEAAAETLSPFENTTQGKLPTPYPLP